MRLIITLFLFGGLFFFYNDDVLAYTPRTSQEAFRFGEQAFFERDWTKALGYFDLAANLDPKAAEPRIRMGLVWYNQNQYKEAENEFLLAQKLKMGIVAKKFIKAVLGKIEKNRVLLTSIEGASRVDEASGRLLILHETAAEKMSEGDLYISLVAPHLDYVLNKSAGHTSRILRFIADAYYASSDHRRASEYYLKLLPLENQTPASFTRLADCLVNVGIYTDARYYYKKALRLAVRDGDIRDIRDRKKKIKALPRETAYLFYLLEQEDYETLSACLKRYFSLNPQDPTAMTLMGGVYEGIGQNFMAERLYKKVIKLYPEYPGGYFYWGRFLLYKKKKFEEVAQELRLFKSTLDEYGPFQPKPSFLKMLEKDRLMATRFLVYIYDSVLNRPGEILGELELCARQNPNNAEIWYDLGCVYLHVKKRASAYTAFKTVTQLSPDSDIAKEAEYAIQFIRKRPDYGGYTGPYD